MRPRFRTRLPDHKHCLGRRAGGAWRGIFLRAEIESATQDQTIFGKASRNFSKEIAAGVHGVKVNAISCPARRRRSARLPCE
jgi:hypothetical protein